MSLAQDSATHRPNPGDLVANIGPMKRGLTDLLKEPVIHFVVVGLVLFLAAQHFDSRESQYQIDIGPRQIERIEKTFQQQYGGRPSPAQMDALLRNYIQQEIFYREGKALGLDRDDEIVRRRIAQKFAFLLQDVSVGEDPTDAQIKTFYAQKTDHYTIPATRSFTQIYFSDDGGGEVAAKARAERVLRQVTAQALSRAPDRGDAFPGPADNAGLTQSDAERLLGDAETARAIFAAPLRSWIGPLRSGYGWHIFYVTEETPPRLPPLADIADRVKADYREQARQIENDRAFAAIKDKYSITIQAPADARNH